MISKSGEEKRREDKAIVEEFKGNETLVKSVQKTGKVVIVHQAVRFMGFGAEVAAQLQEKAFDYLDNPVLRVAAPDVPPPAAPVLEKAFLPGQQEIIEAVKKLT